MRIVVVHENPKDRDYLRQLCLSVGLECGPGDCVGYEDMKVRLAGSASDAVLVVLGANQAQGMALIQQAARVTPAPILAAGPSTDPQLILQAIRAGAREYLDEASLRDELRSALEKLAEAGVVDFRRGRVAGVYSCVPGCGVTTVAAGLAFALAEKRPGKVALAEVGAGVPELALYLDLAPRHTIADLAGSWDRLDRTMLAQALAEHAGGVHVLAHQAETLTAAPLPVQPMQQTLLLLRATFEYAVLDLGHALEPSVVQALKLVETVFFVIHLDVPALRLARRVLHQLAVEHGVSPERVQVVANRAGQRGLISKKQAEETLGRPIVEEIPDDPGTVNEAINNGAPLIRAARRAGITRSFDRLATRLETVA